MAQLKDGKTISEDRGYGLNPVERKGCKIFHWCTMEGQPIISVDLETGLFYAYGVVLRAARADIEDLSNRPGTEYNLIYFKRHFFTMGEYPGEDTTGCYGIGWSIKVEDGKNLERVLYLLPSGDIMFGGEYKL